MRILGVDPGYAIVGFGVLEYTGTTFTPITYGNYHCRRNAVFTAAGEHLSGFSDADSAIPSGLCGDGTTLFHIQPKDGN